MSWLLRRQPAGQRRRRLRASQLQQLLTSSSLQQPEHRLTNSAISAGLASKGMYTHSEQRQKPSSYCCWPVDAAATAAAWAAISAAAAAPVASAAARLAPLDSAAADVACADSSVAFLTAATAAGTVPVTIAPAVSSAAAAAMVASSAAAWACRHVYVWKTEPLQPRLQLVAAAHHTMIC